MNPSGQFYWINPYGLEVFCKGTHEYIVRTCMSGLELERKVASPQHADELTAADLLF